MEHPEKCPLTGLQISNFQRDSDSVYYTVEVNSKPYNISFCHGCFRRITREEKTTQIQHIIKSLLINDKIQLQPSSTYHWHEDSNHPDLGGINLYDTVTNSIYPKQPKELLENLLKAIFELQKYSGEHLTLDKRNEDFWGKLYFKNYDEFEFFINVLAVEGLIDVISQQKDGITIRLTYEGLNRYIKIHEEGMNSNICFIAMSFSEERAPNRLAIKNAIKKTGFLPFVVDEQHISTDRTINDEIIAGIKRSKFCIADFCDHRNGVYFEAGFALGLAKPVIYACSKEEFSKAHFDIKPVQMLIYNSPEELEKGLIHKINAWIK